MPARAAPPTPPLSAPRRAPQQARSQATVDAILEATAALLSEGGFDAVNTNAVAARAGVRPPALYRYFPDKFALYGALAERLQGELDLLLDEALRDADAQTLPALVDRLLDATADFWRRRPAFAALWYGEWAVRGSPPPAIVFGERSVARLAAATKRFRSLGPLRERVTLAAAMHVGMAVINLGRAAPPEAWPLVVHEAKRAVLAYLESVLKG